MLTFCLFYPKLIIPRNLTPVNSFRKFSVTSLSPLIDLVTVHSCYSAFSLMKVCDTKSLCRRVAHTASHSGLSNSYCLNQRF